MLAAKVHEAVATVCPIYGISLGLPVDDKSLWRIDFDPAATSQQRAAGSAALAAFDLATYYADIKAGLVRAECQRRITVLVGAPGHLEAAIIKQLNALMRAVILTNNKHSRELTAQELAEEAALTNLANCIQHLRACSNALEPNPPADYTNDSYWALP